MKKAIKTLLLIGLFTPSLFSQTDENDKLVKKNEKIEKRYIHPKSKYISIASGISFPSTNFKDPNGFLTEGMIMSKSVITLNIMYEQGIKNNFFAEIGYYHFRQIINYKRMIDDNGSSRSIGFYRNNGFQLGFGYRIMNANNFHFLNFHTGLFIGLASKQLTNLPITAGNYFETDPITQLNYISTPIINQFKPISFGTYIGVSKEIRLSDEVRLFAKYFQFFGLNSTISGTIELNSDDIIFNHDASFNVKGGGAFFMGGLKVLLFKNKLN